jgi:hypothetical protein
LKTGQALIKFFKKGIIYLPIRIIIGNNMDDFEENMQPDRSPLKILDWIFLPLPLLFVILGIGILSGLIFKDNLLLQGPTRIILGLLLTVYGIVRLTLIGRRLFGHKKGIGWIKKY